MLGAGSETMIVITQWFVLRMALHPDLQEECAQNIKDVVGKERKGTKPTVGYPAVVSR